jgi:hypothetical protein
MQGCSMHEVISETAKKKSLNPQKPIFTKLKIISEIKS